MIMKLAGLPKFDGVLKVTFYLLCPAYTTRGLKAGLRVEKMVNNDLRDGTER